MGIYDKKVVSSVLKQSHCCSYPIWGDLAFLSELSNLNSQYNLLICLKPETVMTLKEKNFPKKPLHSATKFSEFNCIWKGDNKLLYIKII